MASWNAWPGSSPFSIIPSGPPIYRLSSHEGSHEGPSGSSSVYQSPSPYGRSFSQHPQLDPLPEEPESPLEQPQPPPEARQMRNLACNRRRPPCGTEFDRHRH
ncbi:hypothetical protein J1N35_022665 [Gossypium stocksii]|uniref:Uncharacterized protein n=1 Tax=Gossypium stocksii TaxID=47602 RepID=A0A9D3VIA1_9ROSI|nr:hypothetical protein J1N35_022665 [Gossypium stocksii]